MPLGPEDLIAARAAYGRGENVTAFLRARLGVAENTPEIIEAAYDLQTGSYVADLRADRPAAEAYAGEAAAHLAPWIGPQDRVLDVGSGELTTLSLILTALPALPREILACDLSWSRLAVGRDFAAEELRGMVLDRPRTATQPNVGQSAISVTQQDDRGRGRLRLTPFVADMGRLPLARGAVDVVVSSHALEPNGGALPRLLAELCRVARRMLVLCEPSWEHAGAEGRARMERLGYIRDLPGAARALGAEVVSVTPFARVTNPLNPTAAFVLRPPAGQSGPAAAGFTAPGTDVPLEARDGVLFASEAGLAYPVVQGLPILRESAAILASHLGDSARFR